MSKFIDGMRSNIENQDGIDLRNGCHHITISDITCKTGDDVIALTAIANNNYRPGGSLRSTQIMHNDWSKRDRNIHDITIKNVTAYSDLCYVIRLLPVMSKIWNVRIDGITDCVPDNAEHNHSGTILIGGDDNYGEILPNSMHNITISNVICNTPCGITVGKGFCNSSISNIINVKKDSVLIRGKENMVNVKMENLVQSE